MDPTPQALVRYVLQHLTVKTNVCSFQKHETGYLLQSRMVPDYNFIHVTRGRVVWVIEGRNYPLAPCDLVIVPPHVEHRAYSLTRRITLNSIHVEVTLPGGQDVFALLSPPRFQHVPAGSKLDAYLRGEASEYARPSAADTGLMLPCWAPLIVRELFRFAAERGLLRHRQADPLVAAMLEHLDRCIARPVRLAQLAERSGFSAQHLNRLFRRVLGVTPLQYLARTRMEQAAALLREGRWTVNAVARKVGFEDPYYFSRLFHRHHGQSPSRFRAAAGSDYPAPSSARPWHS